jgi:hypothetical protein
VDKSQTNSAPKRTYRKQAATKAVHKTDSPGVIVSRVPIESCAAERAQWLAELASALEEAQQLAWHLSMSSERAAEALSLYGQLEAVRVEVQSLRLRRANGIRSNSDPNWSTWAGAAS